MSEVAWTECGTVGYEASLCLKEKPKHTAALRILKKKQGALSSDGNSPSSTYNTVAYKSTVACCISPHHELNQDFLALCLGVKCETVRTVRLQ